MTCPFCEGNGWVLRSKDVEVRRPKAMFTAVSGWTLDGKPVSPLHVNDRENQDWAVVSMDYAVRCNGCNSETSSEGPRALPYKDE